MKKLLSALVAVGLLMTVVAPSWSQTKKDDTKKNTKKKKGKKKTEGEKKGGV